MKKIILAFTIFIPILSGSIFNILCAQTNLISNPGFDQTKGKVKEKGQVQVAVGWISATLDNADLFSKNSKNPEYAVPDNIYGNETPDSGENYAGIVAQSFKNSIPRTYLQTEFIQPLEEGKTYCVKFFVSLADLSKFACNDIGAHLSKKEITSVEILKYDGAIKSQVLNPKNRIFDNQDFWEPICSIYLAQGGEKFITIGNFEKGNDAELKKMQRPKGFTKPQINAAYYYIENVSVIPMEEVESCECEKTEKKEIMNVVYKKETAFNKETSGTKNEIGYKKIFFDFQSSEISKTSEKELENVVQIMSENSQLKIQIRGFSGEDEQTSADFESLSEERAKAVLKFLLSKNIDRSRLFTKAVDDSQSVSKENSESEKAQNRRVEFVVVE